MLNKYLGITAVAASLLLLGCSSSNDDSADMTTAGTTAGDTTTEGTSAGDTNTDGETTTGEETVIDATPIDYGNSVMGIIAAQPDTTLFEAAVIAAEDDLDLTLNDNSNMWTVFVPNDTAMEGVTADRAVLLQHIHNGFADADVLTTLIGQEIGMTGGPRRVITLADDGVTLQIDGVNIVESGIVGDNGVVLRIDGVLQ